MSNGFQARWITKEEINSVATRFLKEYHPSNSIPIPIEQIIEFNLGMDVIPVPGLKDSLNRAGLDIDGFISSDFSSITIDEYIQQKRSNRYRFTLAHELGHMMLHAYLYDQYRFKFNTSAEWISNVKKIPSRDRDVVEWQANEFAGLVLVPRALLRDEFYKERDETEEKTFEDYAELVIEDHPELVIEDSSDFVIDVIIHSLAQKFNVSDEVVRIRLKRDRLIK